jgi:hypothetical protein
MSRCHTCWQKYRLAGGLWNADSLIEEGHLYALDAFTLQLPSNTVELPDRVSLDNGNYYPYWYAPLQRRFLEGKWIRVFSGDSWVYEYSSGGSHRTTWDLGIWVPERSSGPGCFDSDNHMILEPYTWDIDAVVVDAEPPPAPVRPRLAARRCLQVERSSTAVQQRRRVVPTLTGLQIRVLEDSTSDIPADAGWHLGGLSPNGGPPSDDDDVLEIIT